MLNTKSDVVHSILKDRFKNPTGTAKAFAPSNIALCKYWGKRNTELNLPLTASLSIALNDKGTTTELTLIDANQDEIILNNQPLDLKNPFCVRIIEFLNLLRMPNAWHVKINTQSNIPIASGLASSASGFASLVLALNQLFSWQLQENALSILARLGSGSACRSLWQGFVEWHCGERENGMDCFAEPLSNEWKTLCIGLLIFSKKEKSMSSRIAMQKTVETSPFMSAWPAKVNQDLTAIKSAIQTKDFTTFGKIAENNALSMHALMLSAWPPITYFLPETFMAMQKIWQLRNEGLAIYFTQDAGPNLKLLFLEKDKNAVKTAFNEIDIIHPFECGG